MHWQSLSIAILYCFEGHKYSQILCGRKICKNVRFCFLVFGASTVELFSPGGFGERSWTRLQSGVSRKAVSSGTKATLGMDPASWKIFGGRIVLWDNLSKLFEEELQLNLKPNVLSSSRGIAFTTVLWGARLEPELVLNWVSGFPGYRFVGKRCCSTKGCPKVLYMSWRWCWCYSGTHPRSGPSPPIENGLTALI